jgi:hypothetical protein
MKEVAMESPVNLEVFERAAGPSALVGYLLGLLVGAAVAVPLVLLLFGPRI